MDERLSRELDMLMYTRNLKEAAFHLHYEWQTLARHIRELESKLRFKIFEDIREHSLRLTPAGKSYLKKRRVCRIILRLAREDCVSFSQSFERM